MERKPAPPRQGGVTDWKRGLLAAAFLGIVLAACGGASTAPSTSPSPSPSHSPAASPAPPTTSPAASPAPPATSPAASPAASPAPIDGEVPAALIDAIRADLEARIGVDVSSSVVVSTEKATWPDGSMGCPKPGEVYIQVIVPGYRVIMSLDGNRYDYRVSDTGIVRFCGLAG